MPFKNNTWTIPIENDIKLNEQLISQETQNLIVPDNLHTILNNIENNDNTNLYAALEISGVDIVIPCFNGLNHLKQCLRNVERHTYLKNVNIIIVNDGSNTITTNYIESLKDKYTIIHNTVNIGFAATCNIGIMAGKNPYVILLNTDVLVTPGWLLKMLKAVCSAPNIGMVNPVTNNIAITSRPLEPGFSYYDMNKAVEMLFKPTYPETIPTGFCLLIKREVLDKIGLFEEIYNSYGEDSSLHMRMLKAIDPETGQWLNYKAVLADNCYVFHQHGASFSALEDIEQTIKRKTASNRFHNQHPDFSMFWNPLPSELTNKLKEIRKPFPKINFNKKINIAFLTFSTKENGAMFVIKDIVNGLIEDETFNVKIVHVARNSKTNLETDYLNSLHTAPILYDSNDNFNELVFNKGIVIGCTAELGPTLVNICKENKNLIPVLFLQSYEPDLAPELENEFKEIYTLIRKIIVNNTLIGGRITNITNVGIYPKVIEPGIDLDMFSYREREKHDQRPTIMILLNKNYFWKNYDAGIKIAEELHKKYSNSIRILACGETKQLHPYVQYKGKVSQSNFARLLGNEVDILIDPSTVHSYGLPALEALYSGCAAISLKTDGSVAANIEDFEIPSPNWAVCKDVEEIIKRVDDLIPCCPLNTREINYEIKDRNLIIDEFKETIRDLCFEKKKIKPGLTFITPHLRKWGGPATIITTANELHKRGYPVEIVSIYKDSINQELIRSAEVPVIFGLENKQLSDVVFVPSDSDQHFNISVSKWKEKVLFKLSHNPRFQELEEQSLNSPDYSKIITSTKWLQECCNIPTEGWNYSSTDANVVGWYNYGFKNFNCHPKNRLNSSPVVIAGLIHSHPLKGTKELISIFKKLKEKYENKLQFVGIGETSMTDIPDWFEYYPNTNRRQMKSLFKQIDIWVGCSQSEGLGRLGLEVMSSSVACVLSDAHKEYVKPEENCLIFPVGDITQAIKQIEKLLDNLDLFMRICYNGYITAENYSDPTRYIDNIEEIIMDLKTI